MPDLTSLQMWVILSTVSAWCHGLMVGWYRWGVRAERGTP